MQAETIPMATVPQQPSHAPDPQPAWNIVQLFPCQGHWDEEDFLSLHTNKLVEFVDGYVEVLPMPTTSHQFIVQYLHGLLLSFVEARSLGSVIFAPLRLRLRSRLIREPDIIFLARENYQHMHEKYWTGADLVIEVVSADAESHERDYVQKQQDYAEARIREYWIVDPQLQRITLLSLDAKEYRVHGEFAPGEQAASVLLDGFVVDAAAVFAAGKKLP
jgi:Uma2 family endonuclease